MPLLSDVHLLPHQDRLAEDARQTTAAGDPVRRLITWTPGSGKGLGSIAAAEAIGQPYGAVVPASLRPTYKSEVQRFTGRPAGQVPVVSYSQLARGTQPDTPTLVFDEATRLTGGSPQAAAAQAAAQHARNLFLLTGTPIRNAPEEFAPYLNALTGSSLSPDDFRRRYVRTERSHPGGLFGRLRGVPAEERTTLNHADELRNLLAGKVDYYSPEQPRVPVTEETVPVELDSRAAAVHAGLMGRLPLALRLKLRYQTGLTGHDLQRLQAFLTGPRQNSLSDLPFQKTDKDPLGAFNRSAKLRTAYAKMSNKLESHPQARGIAYSNYIEAGLHPYAAKLQAEGVPYVMFHGGLSDGERRSAVDAFNQGRARVALIGPAGAEGLSFKGAQLFQLLDEHWHETRAQQAIARGLRHDSHTDLPEELRHYHVQRFVSRLPLGTKDRFLEALGVDRSRQRQATDDYLRTLGQKKRTANEDLLDLLKEVGSKHAATGASSVETGVSSGRPTMPRPDLGHPVTIDRPRGFVKTFPTPTGPVQKTYPVDYGYFDGLVNPDDNEPADVFVGSGGPHYGRFMKGKNLAGTWEPDERKWYAGLTEQELASVHDLFESQSAGLLREHTPMVDAAALVADVRAANQKKAAADPYTLSERLDTNGKPLTRFDLHHDDRNVAYLTSHPATEGGVWLQGMKVDPAYRGQGLGRRLVEHAIARYPDQVLRLRPRPYDDKAMSAEQLSAFYGRLGFASYDNEGRMVRHPDTRVSTPTKQAATSPTVQALLQAKAHSDARDYTAKTHIVRALIRKNPEQWQVDSTLSPGISGLTHVPSGFRLHLPTAVFADLLPAHGLR